MALRPFRPRKPLTPREQADSIRRLNAELGIGPGVGIRGLLIGGGLIVISCLAALALSAPIEPVSPASGVVETVLLTSARGSPEQTAWVTTGGGRWLMRIPAGMFCTEGDRIALYRQRTLTAFRYDIAPGGCTHRR